MSLLTFMRAGVVCVCVCVCLTLCLVQDVSREPGTLPSQLAGDIVGQDFLSLFLSSAAVFSSSVNMLICALTSRSDR